MEHGVPDDPQGWLSGVGARGGAYPAREAREDVLLAGRHFDITERKEAEQQVAYFAFHDKLTGLGNRYLFEQELERAMGRARRSGDSVGVIYVDLPPGRGRIPVVGARPGSGVRRAAGGGHDDRRTHPRGVRRAVRSCRYRTRSDSLGRGQLVSERCGRRRGPASPCGLRHV